jgi:hypothetical protein
MGKFFSPNGRFKIWPQGNLELRFDLYGRIIPDWGIFTLDFNFYTLRRVGSEFSLMASGYILSI